MYADIEITSWKMRAYDWQVKPAGAPAPNTMLEKRLSTSRYEGRQHHHTIQEHGGSTRLQQLSWYLST